ncbi:MAG: efflux RND transporter permease subunit, partial [Spirochaetes bacterium]|nr:efflux RND transporter permease subunit [Spirochaetota bacterium]
LVFLPLFLARHRSRRTSIHLPNFFSGLKSRLECFYRIAHSHPLQVRISIIGGFVFLFGGGITFLLLLPKGEARLHDRTQLDFLIEFESGIPLEQVMAQSDALERFLSQHPCVAQVRVKYDRERANFAIQLSTDRQGPEKDKNQKTLSTLSIPQKRLRLLQEIRHWASRIPHGFLFLPDSSREGSSISVVLSGEDALALQDTALSFARFIQSPREPMEIVFHFKDSLPSKRIIIDPQKANYFGLTPSMIRDYLYTSLSEPVIDKCITHDGETDIRLSFSHPWIRDSKSLVSLPLPSFHGIGVRLIDVGSMVEKNTPRRIYRTNRRRSVSFTVLSDLKDPSDLLTTLKAASEKYPFPEGVTVEIGKEWQETYHMFHQNLFLLGLSFIVLFLILGAYYQGLTYPVLVILQLPLFLSFALWALWIFQIPLSLSVAVGLLLTGGIGVNNALLVFPLSRRPIYASKPIDSDTMKDDFSLLRRFRHSFRSMLTATLTTLAGILPLLFQGNILTSQTPLQTTPFVGISLVVGAGSIGSLLVLWGMVILLEPNRPKG